jgi:polyvinyl alcohol dehydrogenase (cytochrome)
MLRKALPLLLLLLPFGLLGGPPPAAAEKPAKAPETARVSADVADWSSYNYDLLGTRHNKGEKTLGKDNAGRLVEKWRFPPKGSTLRVGVVHATPVVVNGYVYFGTGTPPYTVYKLTPDGQVKWSYRNPAGAKKLKERSFGVPDAGFLNSCLVTNDTVYVGDVGGYIFALNRADGKERWKINTRDPDVFPGGHPSNCVFAAPVLADGKIIVAGGGYEHAVAAHPKHEKTRCTGRGFVTALEPATGKVVWKYDVGPKPEALNPPVKIKDDYGEKVYHFGPSTSSVWSTPSYDAKTGLVYFGTDTHNSPRQPTKDDPRLYTKHSCAAIAVDARTGAEKWVTQINKGDVWNYNMRAYDSKTGLYKDQSIGDTPKPYTITLGNKPTRVVGFGCKNGGFYVLNARTGKLLHNTPLYTGPPVYPPKPTPDPRTLALPGAAGGLQTGCATDGKAVYTNGMDANGIATAPDRRAGNRPPTGGRVVSISLDTRTENWRHERPKVKAVGGTPDKPMYTDVGDPVASGIALANGVAYFTTVLTNQLVAVDTANGKVLKEIPLGPVWCGPSVSRGRVYVGSGNILFSPFDIENRECYFPKRLTGTVYSFGLPGEDEVGRMGKGDE